MFVFCSFKLIASKLFDYFGRKENINEKHCVTDAENKKG